MSLLLVLDEICNICNKVYVFTYNLKSWEVLGGTWQAEFVAICLGLPVVVVEICLKICIFTWQAEFAVNCLGI